MASEQHISLLRQGFKVWNLWRQQNPQSIPELKGADLTGLKLFKVDLSGADLSEVDFSGTSLYQANLSGANLYKANLNAILQEADLSGASLIEANLRFLNFHGTNLSGANLSRANLSGKFYRSTNLNKTNFKSANLSNLDLRDLNLRNSNFIGANLSQANLSATNLSSANFYGANLCKANLNAANLDAANFCRSNLSEANLEYANLRGTQIQEAIIDEKWYLVWDVVNNGAEGRVLCGLDLSMADLEGANLAEADLRNTNLTGSKLNRTNLARSNLVKANLCEANLCEANLSGTDLSKSILVISNLSWADLSGANFREANLARANFDWADFSEADLNEVRGFDSISCRGAVFCGTKMSISLSNTHDQADLSEANFSEGSKADFSEEDNADFLDLPTDRPVRGGSPVRDKEEFFRELRLLSWKNQEVFNESIKELLSSSKKSFIPGILLYTDEDYQLSLYVRQHFDALDKLIGDWCTIYLLENPSPKWRKANQNWRQIVEANLHKNWFRSKPYDKSEVYDIARKLDVEFTSLPCLVLISPANLSEKLVLEIEEVSPKYFRKLFSTLEKLVKSVSSQNLKQSEAGSQVFDYLKLNFNEIVDFLKKHGSKENNSTKYTLEGDNISVSIEPVNINIDRSRKFEVGDIDGDFKLYGSAIMADDCEASGTVAESINYDQDISEEAELENQ